MLRKDSAGCPERLLRGSEGLLERLLRRSRGEALKASSQDLLGRSQSYCEALESHMGSPAGVPDKLLGSSESPPPLKGSDGPPGDDEGGRASTICKGLVVIMKDSGGN